MRTAAERGAQGTPAKKAGESVPQAPSVSLVSINFTPEPTGIAVYSTGLATHLARAGWRVTVHTTFAYYPQWRKQPADRYRALRTERIAECKVVRTWAYVPTRPTAIRRILHEASFALATALAVLFSRTPQLTIVVSPPLPTAPIVLLLARLKGSRTLLHIQDLQPDTALELGMLRPGLATTVLHAIERLTYRLAHTVSTVSDGMRRRIERKGVPDTKLLVLRNWANDEAVRPAPKTTPLRIEWGLDDRFVVLYAGNLGVKQGLEVLLDAAASCTDAPITFVIVGDGGERLALESRARDRGLLNVRFHSVVPVERLPELLATADLCVIPQRAGLSDLVLPSKLGNILASARPVVAAAEPGSDLARVIEEARCGRVVPPGDAAAFAAAIEAMRLAPDLVAMGEHGRRYMQAQLTEKSVLGAFEAAARAMALTGQRHR